MFSRIAREDINCPYCPGEIFLVGEAPAPLGVTGGLTVFVIDINEVNVARYIELPRAELAHAHDPKLRPLARRGGGRTMGLVERQLDFSARFVECEFGQMGHGLGDVLQRRLSVAVQAQQAFQHQLARHPQGTACVKTLRTKCLEGLRHGVRVGQACRQKMQLTFIAATNALAKTRVG